MCVSMQDHNYNHVLERERERERERDEREREMREREREMRVAYVHNTSNEYSWSRTSCYILFNFFKIISDDT